MPVYVDSKTVAAAGTPEVLTTRDIQCVSVLIRAKDSNTGVVYVVDSVTNTKKFPAAGLLPGESVTLPLTDPANVSIDVSVNGEGVDWVAV